MPDSQTAREENQLSCIQTNSSSVYESYKCIPPPKIQRFPTEAPHGCSVNAVQRTSKAITIAPASKHIQTFEHLISPHLLCKLHVEPESQPSLSSAQQLRGDLDHSVPILCCHPLPCSTAGWQAQGGKCQGTWGDLDPPNCITQKQPNSLPA